MSNEKKNEPVKLTDLEAHGAEDVKGGAASANFTAIMPDRVSVTAATGLRATTTSGGFQVPGTCGTVMCPW